MTLYEAYLAGWNACLAGVDGRYNELEGSIGRAWRIGWSDAFDREDDDDQPLPEEHLALSDLI